MAIPSKIKEQKPSLAKGFSRLVFDFCTSATPVKVSLKNGAVLTGVILEQESDTLAMQCQVDRFNSEIVYIPMSSLIYVAIDGPKS